MHLSHTEVQDALREAVAGFLEKSADAEAIRRAEPLGWDPKVWDGLTGIGVPTLGVAEEQGGSGATLARPGRGGRACALASPRGRGGDHGGGPPPGPGSPAPIPLARLPPASYTLAQGGEPVALAVRPATNGVATLVPGAAADNAGGGPRR